MLLPSTFSKQNSVISFEEWVLVLKLFTTATRKIWSVTSISVWQQYSWLNRFVPEIHLACCINFGQIGPALSLSSLSLSLSSLGFFFCFFVFFCLCLFVCLTALLLYLQNSHKTKCKNVKQSGNKKLYDRHNDKCKVLKGVLTLLLPMLLVCSFWGEHLWKLFC